MKKLPSLLLTVGDDYINRLFRQISQPVHLVDEHEKFEGNVGNCAQLCNNANEFEVALSDVLFLSDRVQARII